ncbi:hypothetical protein BJ165DRAFT_1558977 [Panaeolus papilionaceus]|nr:hypothetical protein BJ165DRAFT_1558977 [Panaeolus papilionaceus]
MSPPVWVLKIINIGGALIKGPPSSGLRGGMNRVGEIHKKNKRESEDKERRAIQIIWSKDKAGIGRNMLYESRPTPGSSIFDVLLYREYGTDEVISALTLVEKREKGCNENTPPTEMQTTTKEHDGESETNYNGRRICEHTVIEGDNRIKRKNGDNQTVRMKKTGKKEGTGYLRLL